MHKFTICNYFDGVCNDCDRRFYCGSTRDMSNGKKKEFSICAWCGREKALGVWLDSKVEVRQEASHGMCPECREIQGMKRAEKKAKGQLTMAGYNG